VFGQTSSEPPPPTFMLAIRGYDFELGEPPSAAALANLDAAFELVRALLDQPSLDYWLSRVDQSRPVVTAASL
jgi:hypothetical protein